METEKVEEEARPLFDPSSISPATLSRLLSLYPTTVRNVYRGKLLAKSKGPTKGALKRRAAGKPKPGDADPTDLDPTVPDPAYEKEVERFFKLDEWRYETLPQILAERVDAEPKAGDEPPPAKRMKWMTKSKKSKKKGAAPEPQPTDDVSNPMWFLDKDELVRLMEWKLKHGIFRPTLIGLVNTNPAPHLRISTRAAFKALPDPSTEDIYPEAALQILSDELRGVGPATASLILSVATQCMPQYNDPSLPSIPFFSDELYWWLGMDRYPGGPEKEKLNRASIKYNMKEYGILFKAMDGLRKRIGAVERGEEGEGEGEEEEDDKAGGVRSSLTVVDIEKIAYVIGHIELSGFGDGWKSVVDPEAAGASKEEGEEEEGEDDSSEEEAESKPRKKAKGPKADDGKAGKKRKRG